MCLSLLAAPAVVHPDLQVLSPNHIMVSQSAANSLSDEIDWSILSVDDPAFMTVANPTDVVLFRNPTRPFRAMTGSTFHWSPMSSLSCLPHWPRERRIRLAPLEMDEWEYLHDPSQNWTPSIRVNELGYRGEANDRWGYVSHWLGRLTPMEVTDDHKRFSVVDSDNGWVIMEGRMGLRAPAGSGTDDVFGANHSQATVQNLISSKRSVLRPPMWSGMGGSFSRLSGVR